MRKYIIHTALAIVLCAQTGCSLLDTDPENSIPDTGVIVDESSGQTALIGVYSAVKSFAGLGLVSWNHASDNVIAFSRQSVIVPALQAAGSSAFDPTAGGGYSTYYVAINRANSVIEYTAAADDSRFSAGAKNRIMGEAYFLRALSYFDLARTYGGVPIVLRPSTYPDSQAGIGKSTYDQTLDRVSQDLDMAEELLSGGELSDRARASVWAVYALKARLYLYTEEWDLAEKYATYVIDNNSFSLTGEVSTFFTEQTSSESIFELVSSSSDKNPIYNYYLMPSEGGRLDYIPNPELIEDLIDPAVGGKRSQLIKQRETDGVWVIRVYDKQDGSSSIFTLRLAEQYLIRAEARINKPVPDRDGAAADINAIRDRADIALLDIPTTLSVAELARVIEQERRLELAFEGHRYSDVIRTGRAPALFAPYNSDYADLRYWVFPFPYSAVSADADLEQNDGY